MGTPAIRSVGSSSGTVNNLGRNNLVVGETVTLSDTNPANVGHPHSWALVDRPIGSSAALTTPSGATATFVPDVTGSYFVRCTVDGVSIREVVIAVPLPVSGARIPAFTEQLQYDAGSNTKGWHEALTAFLRATDAARGLRETSGPTVLTMGAVADGKVLARSGNTIVGVNGGHIIEDDGTPVTTRSSLNFTGALVATDGGAGPDRINVDIDVNAVTDAMIRQSTALSLVGRAQNSTGNVADISTTSGSGAVLRESGGTLSFGTVATAGLAANAVTDAVIRQAAALSVIGRSGNSTGNVADIAVAAGSGLVLRESGNALGFGTVGSSGIAAYAIVNGKIRQGAARSVIGNATGATADVADITATNASDAVLRESGGVIGFGTIATGGLANLAVTAAKIANATITATQIANATITTALLVANCVDDTILRQGAARSIIGRSANSIGNVADIAGAGADTVLYDNGTTLAFRNVTAVKESGGQVLQFGSISDGQFVKRSGTSLIGASAVTQAYQTVDFGGTPLTQRSVLNFDGTDFAAVDNSGSTRTDVALATQGGVAGTYTSSTVTVNSKGIITAASSGSAVSITGKPLTYSIVDIANQSWSTTSNAAGGITTGAWWYAAKAMTLTGVRFYWKSSGTNRTITCKLWSMTNATTGTTVASFTVNTTTSGIYSGSFSVAQAIAANTRFAISIRENTGTEYTGGLHGGANSLDVAVMTPSTASGPMMVGPYLFLMAWREANGDVFPQVSNVGDVYYPVEPVLNDIVL